MKTLLAWCHVLSHHPHVLQGRHIFLFGKGLKYTHVVFAGEIVVPKKCIIVVRVPMSISVIIVGEYIFGKEWRFSGCCCCCSCGCRGRCRGCGRFWQVILLIVIVWVGVRVIQPASILIPLGIVIVLLRILVIACIISIFVCVMGIFVWVMGILVCTLCIFMCVLGFFVCIVVIISLASMITVSKVCLWFMITVIIIKGSFFMTGLWVVQWIPICSV